MTPNTVSSVYNTANEMTLKVKKNTLPQVLLILLAFCEKNIVRYAIYALSMIPLIGSISKYILAFIYVFLILMCINKNTRIGLSELFVPFFVIMAIVFTCVVYPQNTQYIMDYNNFWNTIFPCLRWFIVGLIVIPDKEIMILLGKVSCAAIALETVYLLFYMIPNGLVLNDDMSRAYQLLPNIMLVFTYAFNSKKIVAWIFSIVGLFYLLSMGTRGPFLILMVYIGWKFIRTSVVTIQRKIALAFCIFLIGLLGSVQTVYFSILDSIDSFLTKIGLSTRIIDFIYEGSTISYTSGRDDLYEIALQKISERPFLGYGVYGEWQWFGWSAHNMYLELWIHFGVLLGSVLLIWGIWLVGKAYLRTTNSYAKDIICIFSCFVFLRGFFGGSYLMFGVFFLIGFCIKEKRRIGKRVQI